MRPGEHVLRTSRVSRERVLLSALGLLYLTDQRLVFCPYLFTLSWTPLITELQTVTACGEALMPSYRNLAHLFVSIGWYVEVPGHRHFFVSLSEDDKDEWIRAISSVANVPIGERRAF
jgi:hypothetical protein